MKRDCWVKYVDGVWILRFGYDWDSWQQNQRLLTDRRRLMSNGTPLLKIRNWIRRDPAIVLQKDQMACG